MFDVVDQKKWLSSLVIAAIVGFLCALLWKDGLGQVHLDSFVTYGSSVGMAIFVAGTWHLLLTKWLWRWHRLRPWYVKCPDLSGSYRAELVSRTFGTKSSEAATIQQTMEVLDYVSESRSGNINRSISSRVIVDGLRLRCFITYEATNARDEAHGMDHQGTIVLTAVLGQGGNIPKRLSGYYFTNKPRSKEALSDRGTYGDITLVRLEEAR